MKKNAITLLVSLILSIPLTAQKAPDDPCVRELMGHYIDYINDNIYAIGVYHEQLELANRKLNEYYEASPLERQRMVLSITFQEIRTNRRAFEAMLPTQRYAVIKSKEGCIPEKYRADLQKYTDQMKDIVDELAKILGNLEQYAGLANYRQEPKLKTAYKWLSRAYVLYHDLSVIKDAMYYELNKLYREQQNIDPENPYARSTRALMSIIVPARAVLKALKTDNARQVANNANRLKMAIERVESQQAANLKGAKVIGSDPMNHPDMLYAYVVGVAKDFYAASQEFGGTTSFPTEYEQYGKGYYFYNNRVLSHYNRLGDGMIYRYNRMVTVADVTLLKMVEEPTWFKVISPKPQRTDPEPEAVAEADPEPIDTTEIATADAPPDEPPAPEIKPEEPLPTLEGAAPNNLVFLLDVSSSMEDPDKLPLLKQSFKYLLGLMRPQDRVAIVTYSGNARVVLPSTSSSEKNRIIQAIDGLTSEGKSDALEGVILAYRVAGKNFIEEGNNRIILASDGYFRIPDALPRLVKDKTNQDILMSVFFFGEEEARITERLTRLADLGQGNFKHIRTDNATRLLIEEAKAVQQRGD